MNYKKMIEGTVVPSNMSEIEKYKYYDEMEKYIGEIMPNKLYRFRECNERNFDAFLKDELWFCNGGVVNDAFDSRLYCNQEQFKEWEKSVKTKETKEIVKSLLNDINALPKELLQMNPNAQMALEYYKKIDINRFTEIYDNVIKEAFNDAEGELSYIINQVQKTVMFTCFSENIESAMMWGQYGDSMRGFALEYDFDRKSKHIFNNGAVICNLFKMIYDEKRLDTTDYLIYIFKFRTLSKVLQKQPFYTNQLLHELMPMLDEFMATKLSLKKSVEWKYEKEWRMFYSSSTPKKQDYVSVVKKPSAIYLGSKIGEFYEKALISIANEKKLPVYKMKLNLDSRKYNLNRIKVN